MNSPIVGRSPFINSINQDTKPKHQQAANLEKLLKDDKATTEEVSLFTIQTHDIKEEDHEDALLFKRVLEQKAQIELKQQQQTQTSNVVSTNRYLDELGEAKYIESEDLDQLFEFFEMDKFSFDSIDPLIDKVGNMEDGLVEQELAGFFNANQFTKAQIYMMLNYIYNELTKKHKNRKALLAMIFGLLKQFENQESGYLFEFFSILGNSQLKEVNTKLINGMASINSGSIAIVSIKQMLSFIRETLNGEFENLVSSCIKHRLHILKRVAIKDATFEQKTELAEYLRFEKTLIAVHSIYLKAHDLRKDSAEQIKYIDNNFNFVSAVANFAEIANITEMAINTLCKQIVVIQDMSKINHVFIKRLAYFYSKLPMLIYNNLDERREKLMAGLRDFSEQMRKRESVGAKFSFLKQSSRDDKQDMVFNI